MSTKSSGSTYSKAEDGHGSYSKAEDGLVTSRKAEDGLVTSRKAEDGLVTPCNGLATSLIFLFTLIHSYSLWDGDIFVEPHSLIGGEGGACAVKAVLDA